MKNKTLLSVARTPVAGMIASATFLMTACTDYYNGFTAEQLSYEASFQKDFGKFDPTNDFNLAQRGQVTVTPNGNREVCVYKKAANGYQLIARYDDVTTTRTLGFDIPKGETEILVVNGSATKTTTVGGTVTFERGGGSGAIVTRAIYTKPDDPADWATRLFKGKDGSLEVKLNNGQDYTYYYYNASEATSFETILPESRLNRDKAVDDFSLISTGEFIIYPTYWNAAVATQVGIYYYDDEGNIHKQPIFGNHIYNESIQYWDGNNWVTPKSEGYNSMNAGGKGWDYYPLTSVGASQYRSKGIIVNLPVGTKFGFYTPMFEDNPTSRKAVGDYLPFKDWTNAIGMNTNVYIPNNINGAVYTKFGGTTGQQWGLTENFHLNTTTNCAGETKYAKWWFKDGDGYIEANWNQNQAYLDAHSESHLNPPDVWDQDYTNWNKDVNAATCNPLKYDRHAVMFGMYYDEKGDMVIGAEDAYFLTSSDQSDYDLNDRVFKIYGSQPLVLNNKAQSWHLAFEDLGGSFDWDFNDVVLQIDYVSGQEKARITPIAAGGTLHSQVYFNDTDNEGNRQPLGEIHEWLGATTVGDDELYEPINADSRGVPGVRKEVTITSPSTFSIADAMEKANIAGNGSSKDILGLYIETSGNGEGKTNTIAYKGMGKAPAMLVLPTSYESGDKYLEWAWPTENYDIRKAYNTDGHKFSDWVADHSKAQDWFMYPSVKGTVEAKVAGKYANGSTTAGSEYDKSDYGTILTQLNKNDANLYVFDANSTLGDAKSVTITFALKGKLANNALYAYDGNKTTGSALGSWFRLNNGGSFATMGDKKNTGTTTVEVEGMYQITLSEADLTAIKNAGHWAITASADSEIIYIASKKE